MNALPEDGAARLERLEGWAAQQRQLAEERRGFRRLRRASRRIKFALMKMEWSLESGSQRFVNRVLDRRLHTSGNAHEPEHDHPDRVGYVPSAWNVLPRALHFVGVSSEDTFVDFGCGKGRIVHQAARRPFRRVIGVEISPVLAEIARTGLAARRHQHRCRSVEIVVSDVRQFRVPDDVTMAYLYHPFVGETFDALLRHIVDSLDRHPRRLRLIYQAPAGGAKVLSTGRFGLVEELRIGRSFGSRVAIFESR